MPMSHSHRLRRILRHPAVGLLGLLLGVAGLLFGAWSHWSSRQYPEFRITHLLPDAAVIAEGRPEGLEIQYGGETVVDPDNLYVAKFWIENRGTEPILRNDVLRPIRLSPSDSARPLVVSTSSVSRDVVELIGLVGRDNTKSPVVDIEFAILEPGDSGVITVIYVSPSTARFTLEGSVLGHREVALMRVAGEYRSAAQVLQGRILLGVIGLLVVVGVVIMCANTYKLLKIKIEESGVRKAAWDSTWAIIGPGMAGILMIGTIFVAVYAAIWLSGAVSRIFV